MEEQIRYGERIFLKAEISQLNKRINGICKNVNYDFSSAYIFIMKNFYGITVQRNAIIKKYTNKVSPISTFNKKALTHFKAYLNNVITTYDKFKNNLEKTSPATAETKKEIRARKKEFFITTIVEEAEKIRIVCKKNHALPEYNDDAERLPDSITAPMLKKYKEVFKKANLQTSGTIDSIIDKHYENNKRRQIEKQQEAFDRLEFKHLELIVVKEKLLSEHDTLKQNLQEQELLDLAQIENHVEIRDIRYNIYEINNELDSVAKDMKTCQSKIKTYKEQFNKQNIEKELEKNIN